MSRAKWFALAGWVVLAGAAAGPGRAQEDERRDADRPADVRRAKAILGAKVSIKGDTAVGTVDDIVFSEDGYVDYLAVVSDGRYVLVPWEAARFNAERRVAVIAITPERYREVPTFTQERWPNVYEPAYRQKVYGYYGLKPRPVRRIDRR